TVNGAERGEQATPSIEAPLEYLFSVEVGRLSEPHAERGDGVVLVKERVPEKQQAALLSSEEKDQTHHHGDRGFVELALGDIVEQHAPLILVSLVERLHQHFHRSAHLVAKLVRDLFLGARALSEQGLDGVAIRHSEEALDRQQTSEC